MDHPQRMMIRRMRIARTSSLQKKTANTVARPATNLFKTEEYTQADTSGNGFDSGPSPVKTDGFAGEGPSFDNEEPGPTPYAGGDSSFDDEKPDPVRQVPIKPTPVYNESQEIYQSQQKQQQRQQPSQREQPKPTVTWIPGTLRGMADGGESLSGARISVSLTLKIP